MKNFFKHFCILILLLSTYIFVCAFSYAQDVSSDLSQAVFRLHVIANSNSYEDQELKLDVRDAILTYIDSLSDDISSKEKTVSSILSNIDQIKLLAQETVRSYGFNYSVNVDVGNYDFPTKIYGDIVLPARKL